MVGFFQAHVIPRDYSFSPNHFSAQWQVVSLKNMDLTHSDIPLMFGSFPKNEHKPSLSREDHFSKCVLTPHRLHSTITQCRCAKSQGNSCQVCILLVMPLTSFIVLSAPHQGVLSPFEVPAGPRAKPQGWGRAGESTEVTWLSLNPAGMHGFDWVLKPKSTLSYV